MNKVQSNPPLRAMSDAEFAKYHDDRFAELPDWIIEKSKEALLYNISQEDVDQIRKEIDEVGVLWCTPYHSWWGMKIRNLLRDKVCRDSELPVQNWDDYYVTLVEYAVGKRTLKRTQ